MVPLIPQHTVPLNMQLTKTAIWDGVNLVTLSVVQEGADDATRSVFKRTPKQTVIEDDQPTSIRMDEELILAGLYNTTDGAQLASWAENLTNVSISGYNYGYIFRTVNDVYLQSTVGPNGDVAGWRIAAKDSTMPGYHSGVLASKFLLSRNGIGDYQWGDANSDGLANGWTSFGFATKTMIAGVQNLTHTDANSNNNIHRTITFPFPGKTLTMSANFTAIGTSTGYANTMWMQAYDSSGSAIGSPKTEVLTGTGINTVSYLLPGGTVTVELRPINSTRSSGTVVFTCSLRDVMLTIDGTTNYVQI